MFSLRSNSIADRFALSVGAVFADCVHNFKKNDGFASLISFYSSKARFRCKVHQFAVFDMLCIFRYDA